jgi:hypothetical protein
LASDKHRKPKKNCCPKRNLKITGINESAQCGNEPIEPLIAPAIKAKFKMRGGMDTLEKFQDPSQYEKNRSMITVGG